MSPSLRKNFSWAFVANVVYSVCQWAQLMFLARTTTPDVVGQFSLGIAITAPVFMLANLQLRAVQATDVVERYRFDDYLALRIGTSAIALLVIFALTLLPGYRSVGTGVVFVIGLQKAVESVSDIYYGRLQQHERLDLVAFSLLIKGPVLLIAWILSLRLTGQLIAGIWSLVAVHTMVLLLYDIPSSIRLPLSEPGPIMLGWLWRWRGPVYLRLGLEALPLGVAMGLISLNSNIPRYVLGLSLGEYAVGIYSALVYVAVAGNMVVNALGQSAGPRLARYYTEGNQSEFSRLLYMLALIGAGLGVAGVLAASGLGRYVLVLLYGREYAGYVRPFVVLMIGAGVQYVASFMGYGMTATRQFRAQVYLLLIVTTIVSGASFFFIPRMGLEGAGVALIASAIAQGVGSWIIVSKSFEHGKKV